MPDPVSRLATVSRSAIPSWWASLMASAASDWAASRLASAIEQVAVALVAEEQSAPHNGALVRAHQSLMRP